MPFVPQQGDFVVRNSVDVRFELVDTEGRRIAGPFSTLAAAVARARFQASDRISIWQQRVDERGRPMGPPGMLLPGRAVSAGT